MSCALTQNLNLDCRTESGGIQHIWVVEYSSSDTVTKSSGEISAHTLANARAYFKWEFPKNTASLVAPFQVNQENGTVFYEATLTIKLQGLSQTIINELKLAAKSRLRIIVKDNEGNYWMMGANTGVNMTGGSQLEIGANMGDFKGGTMVFLHQESDSINKVQSAVVSSLSLS